MGRGSAPVLMNKYFEKLPTVIVKGKAYRFLNGIGYGIDGYCCEEGDKKRAKSNRKINYTAIALKGVIYDYKPRNLTVTIDGETHEYKNVWLAPTMNGRFFGGGMMATPHQDRLNPERTVSFMTAAEIGSLKVLTIFPSIYKGRHVKYDAIKTFTGRHIIVAYDRPCALQIDGNPTMRQGS